MRRNRLWILGPSDPEMEAIERWLCDCGERVECASVRDALPSIYDTIQTRQTPYWGFRDYILHSAYEGMCAALDAVELEARRLVGAGAQSQLSLIETVLKNLRKELDAVIPKQP